MDSIDSSQDLELIAAFIDGRLSAEERARAMKLLADSDEALELFASALRHQADAPDVKVVPIDDDTSLAAMDADCARRRGSSARHCCRADARQSPNAG